MIKVQFADNQLPDTHKVAEVKLSAVTLEGLLEAARKVEAGEVPQGDPDVRIVCRDLRVFFETRKHQPATLMEVL